MKRLIDKIKLPQGLRGLSYRELEKVSSELRSELIDSVALSGGHLASSLGVTELSVALHYFFDTPKDRIIWDVGHQAYIHKMLTGRLDKMSSIRKKGGIAGFLRRDESPYDAFGAGHAGTSISAALGMALALEKTDPERSVVAVLGDGAMTCGMSFEALNHAGDVRPGNLIVVLNDNEMSIAPNVGAVSRLLSMAMTSYVPTRARLRFKDLYKRGYIPHFIYKLFYRVEKATQSFVSGPAMFFESLGFRYIGPVDGHNIKDLVRAFAQAKKQDVPVLVHVITKKGRGYKPAESNPTVWHGVRPFYRDRGEFVEADENNKHRLTYTDVFSKSLVELAKDDPSIVAITAAMPTGTGLDRFQKEFPERFFDVGICEPHAVTLAAGMACEGKKPVVALYSTFLQRAYDQVLHDVCLQKLPVVFAIDRAGVVGGDGETHQGVFDISFLRHIPNLVVMAPKDANELQDMLASAFKMNCPVAIRYPRGEATGDELRAEPHEIAVGKAEVVYKGNDVLLLAVGNMVERAVQVAKLLQVEGVSATVVNARFIKPLDSELLKKELLTHRLVCTIEDHVLAAGFGSAVLEFASDNGLNTAHIKRFGVGDHFVPHATQDEQYLMNGYDADSIVRYIMKQFSSSEKIVQWSLPTAV